MSLHFFLSRKWQITSLLHAMALTIYIYRYRTIWYACFQFNNSFSKKGTTVEWWIAHFLSCTLHPVFLRKRKCWRRDGIIEREREIYSICCCWRKNGGRWTTRANIKSFAIAIISEDQPMLIWVVDVRTNFLPHICNVTLDALQTNIICFFFIISQHRISWCYDEYIDKNMWFRIESTQH